MQPEPSFTFTSLLADSTEPRATSSLGKIVAKLVRIRDFLDFGMSKRDITPKNLITLEKELRDILKEIATSYTTGCPKFVHAASASLRDTLASLNLATDALETPTTTLKIKEQLYQKYYKDIHKHISLTIEHLQSR